MISRIRPDDMESLRGLIQEYVDHVGDEKRPIDELLKRYGTAVKEGRVEIYVAHDSANTPCGCIFYSRAQSSLGLIYARHDFEVERALFDYVFATVKTELDYLSFESGYPTPLISSEFSDYVERNEVKKHDRAYMRLERCDFHGAARVPESIEIIPFSVTQMDEITHIVFRAVNGTVDQDLWPNIYGTEEATLDFHQSIVEGKWGVHGSRSSWVAKFGPNYIGVCLLVKEGDTGSVMHLAVDPDWRRRGIGRALLTHSVQNLFDEDDNLFGMDLAVTMGNPAMQLYESVGFVTLNFSSSYIWKNENH